MNESYTTEANVEKATLLLLAKNKNPSVDNIRGELALMFGFADGDKKGSPNEVLKFKRAWQEKISTQLQVPTPKHIPEAVLSNFESIWDANQALANHEFESHRSELISNVNSLEKQLAEAQADEIRLSSALESLVSESEAKEASLHKSIEDLENEKDRLTKSGIDKDNEITGYREAEIVLIERLKAAESKIEDQKIAIDISHKKLDENRTRLEEEKIRHTGESDKLNARLSEQASLLSSSKDEVAKAEDLLQAAIVRSSELEKHSLQLERDVSSKNSDLEHLKREKDNLTESLRLAEERADRENSKANSTQLNYEKLMDRYGVLNEKYSALVEKVLSKPQEG